MKKTFDSLITITNAGFEVASYPEIREALVQRMKEIYGSDIDVSTGSADGIWIESLSLVINNILQSFLQLNANLNPDTATGIYLDVLSSLTNVIRKRATKSKASVLLLNNGAEDITINQSSDVPFQLVDKAGVTWTVTSQNVTLVGTKTRDADKEKYASYKGESVICECDEYGSIRAEKGWIDDTMELNGNIVVTQEEMAQVGSNAETDSELRARRNSYLASNSRTVTEGLTSSLLDITGIKDCIVYSNNTNGEIHTDSGDRTPILAHSIYVVLRYDDFVSVSDLDVASIIYNKMTPGIATTKPSDTSTAVTYNMLTDVGITQPIYWKKAKGIAPQVVITITPNEYFASGTEDTGYRNESSTNYAIATNVRDYLNGLQINEPITQINITNKVFYSDPLFKSHTTFAIKSITVGGSETDYKNSDSYYKYTNLSVTKSGKDFVITLK